jgi:uncharacterized protein with GYD domain
VICLIFIILIKWKKAPTKEMRETLDQGTKQMKELEKQGIKAQGYWTLGRYDGVSIVEAPSEKDVMKILLSWQEIVETETMVAVPRNEAIKLL